MKNILLTIGTLAIMQTVYGQITITAADMPVAGDTLRYSFASPVGTMINPGDSGASMTWNYSLTPVRQAVDTYQTALSVNPLYVVTVGITAYGYKVADSFPIPIPLPGLSVQKIYTFFEKKTSPSRYQAQAFAANISGLPTAFSYSSPDVWYFFPLTYMRNDSAHYALNITIPTLGGIKQVGYRKSRVDGWGTITTPYYTTPVNCIRVRSEIHEIDSIPLPIGGGKIGFPRNSVEYKWLVNGEHYPALWVTSNLTPAGETISNIRYRDNPMPDTTVIDNSVHPVENTIAEIKAWPVPSQNGVISLDLPADWKIFEIEVYDLQSRVAATFSNERQINISALPTGQYIARVICGTNAGYVKITR